MLPVLALSHIPGSIFRLSRKHSLFPTSLTRLSIGVPYGFACLKLLQAKDGVTTFHTVDPLDDLGVSSTPGVPQFRTGSYETCILTPCHKLWEVTQDLLILVGPSLA